LSGIAAIFDNRDNVKNIFAIMTLAPIPKGRSERSCILSGGDRKLFASLR